MMVIEIVIENLKMMVVNRMGDDSNTNSGYYACDNYIYMAVVIVVIVHHCADDCGNSYRDINHSDLCEYNRAESG